MNTVPGARQNNTTMMIEISPTTHAQTPPKTKGIKTEITKVLINVEVINPQKFNCYHQEIVLPQKWLTRVFINEYLSEKQT